MTNPPGPNFSDYRPQAERGPAPPPPADQRQPRRRKSGGGLLSWVLFLVVALVFVIGGALAYLALNPPTAFIRDQLVTQVKQKTGRDLTIAGPIGLTFWPSIGVSVQDVTLSPPPGMDGAPFAKIADLNVQVKLLPLISREVEVDTLVLTDPVFDLRVDAAGKKSWDFAQLNGVGTGPGPARVQLADASAAPSTLIRLAQAGAPSGTGASLPLSEIRLGDVRLVNGTLLYADQTTGTSERLDKINVALGLETLASPLKADGDVTWNGEAVTFDGTLTAPQDMMENRPANLALKFSGRPVSGTYNGTVSAADGVALAGKVSADTASTRGLAAWLGTALPPSAGFGPLTFTGDLTTTGATYTLKNAALSLDGATATGDISANTAGVRPKIVADLTVSQLDINPYIEAAATGPGTQAKPAPTPPEGAGADTPAASKPATSPQSIDDLLSDPATRVKGYTQRSGWSTEPIDVSGLGLIDADARLKIGKLLYKKIVVDSTNLLIKLAAGNLRADFTDVRLYQGTGRGVVTVEGKGTPTVGANVELKNISALPLLTDAAEFKSVDGNGDLTLAVAGRGSSQKAIVDTLNGNGSFAFNNGAIVGINIPAMIRGVSQGDFSALKTAPSEKTDFSQLSATFQIVNGTATNTDLNMQSPLLRLSGEGKAMLPAREVDYLVRPKIVADLSGQGGSTGLEGLEIPVRITGPFDKPKFQPQLGDILKNPSAATETIKKLGERFKGKNTGEIVNDLLGGGNAKSGDGASGEKKIDTKKLLDNLFR